MKKYYPDKYVAKPKKAYEELPITKSDFYTVPALVVPQDSLLRYPAKVALVANELCGSSTEYFFHLSKSSWTDSNPIDETGFTPDVKLSIPGSQWVNYIKEALKKSQPGFPAKK